MDNSVVWIKKLYSTASPLLSLSLSHGFGIQGEKSRRRKDTLPKYHRRPWTLHYLDTAGEGVSTRSTGRNISALFSSNKRLSTRTIWSVIIIVLFWTILMHGLFDAYLDKRILSCTLFREESSWFHDLEHRESRSNEWIKFYFSLLQIAIFTFFILSQINGLIHYIMREYFHSVFLLINVSVINKLKLLISMNVRWWN